MSYLPRSNHCLASTYFLHTYLHTYSTVLALILELASNCPCNKFCCIEAQGAAQTRSLSNQQSSPIFHCGLNSLWALNFLCLSIATLASLKFICCSISLIQESMNSDSLKKKLRIVAPSQCNCTADPPPLQRQLEFLLSKDLCHDYLKPIYNVICCLQYHFIFIILQANTQLNN